MRMAENAAKLISENLKYPDGTPVQCVIGCTTIGGGAEAARVAEQFLIYTNRIDKVDTAVDDSDLIAGCNIQSTHLLYNSAAL